jgi:hypothetical protein
MADLKINKNIIPTRIFLANGLIVPPWSAPVH